MNLEVLPVPLHFQVHKQTVVLIPADTPCELKASLIFEDFPQNSLLHVPAITKNNKNV